MKKLLSFICLAWVLIDCGLWNQAIDTTNMTAIERTGERTIKLSFGNKPAVNIECLDKCKTDLIFERLRLTEEKESQ